MSKGRNGLWNWEGLFGGTLAGKFKQGLTDLLLTDCLPNSVCVCVCTLVFPWLNFRYHGRSYFKTKQQQQKHCLLLSANETSRERITLYQSYYLIHTGTQ